MEKSPLAAGGLPPGLKARAMTLASWEDHARQQKAFAYPFSNTALLQQEPLIQGWVDKLVAALGKIADEGKHANMTAWFTYTTFDIIGDLCFDEPFGCLDAGQATDWSKNIVNIGTAGAFEQATRRVAGIGTWLQGQMANWLVPSVYRTWRMKHFALSAEKTKRRIADNDKEHKDFIYYILKNNESKSLLSDLEIIMNSALFIGAGSDTTAIALSAWMYLMLTNEKAYNKLVAEIRGAFKSHKDITWNGANDLPYLEACIYEAMRMFPPVPGNLNRVVPSEGALIDGKWIAGETTVSVSSWAAAHSPKSFTDPLTFAPERWLESERDRYPQHIKEASQPFLTGPRGCIGKNLSYIEQRLIICHLLWNFDLELASEASEANKLWRFEGDMKHMVSYLIWEKPDLWVKLKRVVR
ncbi:cytochrome P450 [Coniochaeta ligniaria NRRL 30616]|uniref:Cytochrome P450 n=1 Tax=Coniochaeta ligniaria NRRL 30616 TaxID=1408157 RepID=A0A1J7J2E6_9PEZI|nr:cytochrome P450 [Coniochaeta ligniaria NRRL 30616]